MMALLKKIERNTRPPYRKLTWGELESAIKKSGMSPVDFAHAAGTRAVSVGLIKAGKPVSQEAEEKLARAARVWNGGGRLDANS